MCLLTPTMQVPSAGPWNRASLAVPAPTPSRPTKPAPAPRFITFLYRAAGSPDVSAYQNPFDDVTADDYYYAAAIWAAANNIAGGTSSTTFAPGATCTRSQVVTFLYRAAGSPATKVTDAFSDVAPTDYYGFCCGLGCRQQYHRRHQFQYVLSQRSLLPGSGRDVPVPGQCGLSL